MIKMQHIKGVILLFLAIILSGCTARSTPVPASKGAAIDTSDTPSVAQQATHIALLLPLSGPQSGMGRSVRDGFLSAYYEHGTQHISVQMYDTGGTAEKTREAYEAAKLKGATLVVGPLVKTEVQALLALKPTLPVLALNSITERPASQFYQFALLPEDEINSIVQFAWSQQYRVIVIVESPHERGRRLAKNFKEQWQKKGGKILKIENLDRQGDMQARLQAIASAYEHQEDTPGKVPDAFFLATGPEVARQIKPLLDFHYRPNTPVLSTANVYTGIPSPLKDQDLNGIIFCDMPWVLEESGAVQEKRQQAEQFWSKSDKEAPRLFALGIDAFRIAAQWNAFVSEAGLNLSGMTGQLSLDKRTHQVHRHLSCSRFVDGQPKNVGRPHGFE
jgi:outer membrane PBP1 activator LpoA protein